MFVPALSAATTFAVSVTSALASIPSSFVPSEATFLPSTVPSSARFPLLSIVRLAVCPIPFTTSTRLPEV